MDRPDYVNDEHLEFLDNLRETGVTNMFGAGRYIEVKFGIDKDTAGNILGYWMDSFGREDR